VSCRRSLHAPKAQAVSPRNHSAKPIWKWPETRQDLAILAGEYSQLILDEACLQVHEMEGA
jgi:hypothetical protein